MKNNSGGKELNKKGLIDGLILSLFTASVIPIPAQEPYDIPGME